MLFDSFSSPFQNVEKKQKITLAFSNLK